MNYNRRYSKNFGLFLMVLAMAIYLYFGNVLFKVEDWGVDSNVFSPTALLWAFASVGTFFTGFAFFRGVFLMSDDVIKQKPVEVPVEAEATV